jgi:RNA polymerase sigma-70 factor (ECF subfamily)
VFVKLWKKRESIHIAISEKNYLHRAVINTSLNYLEKNKRLQSITDQEDSAFESRNYVDEEIHHNELERNFHFALQELPPVCQTVFSLSRLKGLTNREISEQLNVSIKAVEKHIGKALKHLRLRLKPYLNKEFLWLLLVLYSFLFLEVGFLVPLTVILMN